MSRKRIIGRITSDVENVVADVVMSKDFFDLEPIERADLLGDALFDLQELYNKAVAELGGPILARQMGHEVVH